MTHPNRDEQHGGMEAVGTITQQIKAIIRTGRNWHQLTPGEQEALDMAAHKTARILSGANPHDPEHWRDLAGYAVAARRGDSPECAPPEPSQWRNDRPPAGSDEADPTSLPPQPEPAPTRWITDRVPTPEDGDSDQQVKVPARVGGGYTWIDWSYVHPGTPWSPTGAEPGPWDPTTLDRNGWIRSRLPTVGDAHRSTGRVWIPCDIGGHVSQHYTFVTPGQPWAPWGSDPGIYQP